MKKRRHCDRHARGTGSRRDIKEGKKILYERERSKKAKLRGKKTKGKNKRKRKNARRKERERREQWVKTNRRGRNEETWHTEEGAREGENERAARNNGNVISKERGWERERNARKEERERERKWRG